MAAIQDSIKWNEVFKRESILKKAHNGEKISKEERLWLLSHSLYNRLIPMCVYNEVIEDISFCESVVLTIMIEYKAYNSRIIPIIKVPGAKGKIIADFDVYDINERLNPTREVKMLGLLDSACYSEYKIEYISELGLLGVSYECDYYDETVRLHKRESSSAGNPNFAIIRQVVNDSTIRYCCKAPTDNLFDALVFSVNWKRTDRQ